LRISLLIYVIDDALVCDPAVSMERVREVGSRADTQIPGMIVTLFLTSST
jgi:hypothetical protein